ncbi:imidazoleglycerol-phosphate dehydratase [Thermoplasmatales archaeon SW_10_69_26]|nr:MAG: imidazoleglycerol-phosphate dehydratase [Thermoplasmatales archaeon SW_10_69_26]
MSRPERFTAERSTGETRVHVDVEPVPAGEEREAADVRVDWNDHGGLDEPVDPAGATHLVETLLRYARLSGTVEATGDLAHHVVEDLGITLGAALAPLAEAEIARFADRTVPMDEALVQAALDLGGRAHHETDLDEVAPLADHVARSLALNANATLHLRVLRDGMRHHVAEAATKALGLCLREAMRPSADVESTKGHVEWGTPEEDG